MRGNNLRFKPVPGSEQQRLTQRALAILICHANNVVAISFQHPHHEGGDRQHHDEIQSSNQQRQREHARPARHAYSGCDPYRACGCQSADCIVVKENHACAKESDTRNHLRRNT